MLSRPDWFYYVVGVLMFVVAAYGAALFVISFLQNRSAGRDVELSHVAMGLAMAGMFVPSWSFGPASGWVLVFVALLVWFVVRSLLSVERFGLHLPHTAIHALMSFAMLLMFWFPGGSASGSMSMSMSGSMSGGTSHGIDPSLAFVVAFVLFGSAVFTIASPNRGATYYGTHGPCSATAVLADARGSDGVERTPAPAVVEVLDRPVLLDASHVVMSAAMGLMLVLMLSA